MRKLLLISILFLQFNSSSAQSRVYHPFPSNMVINAWTEAYIAGGGPVYSNFRTQISGDTVIGGFNYSRWYTGTGPFTFFGGIRNDTLNRKVYMYVASSGTEKLLYDFSLSVGDTVNSSNGFGFYDPLIREGLYGGSNKPDTAWVSSIDSVLMPYDGLYHKRFNFEGKVKNMDSSQPHVLVSSNNPGPYSYGGLQPDFYITLNPLVEGVGQIVNPVSHYSFFEVYWNCNLFCASINGSPAVNYMPGPSGNPALCNLVSVGINNEENNRRTSVFPNPASGVLTISSELLLNYVEVSSVLGNVVCRFELSNSSEVDISALPANIYFLRFCDKNGNSFIKKIVKQ